MALIERPGLAMPFCNSGNKNTIQVASSESLTNFETGFPVLQATPLGMAGAEEVKREDFNGLFNIITSILYSQQMGTPNMWRRYVPGTEQTTQTRVAYPKGAHVYFNLTNDLTSAVELVSTRDDNTVIPIDTSGQTVTNNIGPGKAWDFAANQSLKTETNVYGTYIKFPNGLTFAVSSRSSGSGTFRDGMSILCYYPVTFRSVLAVWDTSIRKDWGGGRWCVVETPEISSYYCRFFLVDAYGTNQGISAGCSLHAAILGWVT